MKRNISDMLNEVAVDDVQLREKTPLSARNIRQRTMGLAGESKTKTVRWLPRVAVVAAALMMLMISACAADTAFNDGKLFGGFFGSNLSKKQAAVLNSIGKHYSNGEANVFTSNGATLTPISAVCDGRLCYIHIRLEAPKGMVLKDLSGNMNYSFHGTDTWNQPMEVKFGYERYDVSNATVNTLPDADPTDNIKEFVLEIYAYWTAGFNGSNVRISIPGLWRQGAVNPTTGTHFSEKVLDAQFEFDITIDYDFDKERLDLNNRIESLHINQYDFTLNLESILLTPLRMEIHYTATLPENEDILPDGGYAQIVMKDDTRLIYGDQSKISDGANVGYQRISMVEEFYGLKLENIVREANLDQTVRFTFTQPLVLDDIDYIIWCGGQIIDVN